MSAPRNWVVGLAVSSVAAAGLYSLYSKLRTSRKYLPQLDQGLVEDARALEIVAFWFDGPIEANYRDKWFASKQDEIDKYITTRWGRFLLAAEEGRLQHWKRGPLSFLALILLLDQFSRHVYRRAVNVEIKKRNNDALALACALSFLRLGFEKFLTLPQRVFLLLPLRHSRQLPHLRHVVAAIEQLEAWQGSCSLLLARFRKQSVRALQTAECKARSREAHASLNILEREPREVDETKMPREKLYRAMLQFVKIHCRQARAVAVSLSGGVDSMVVAKLLAVLSRSLPFTAVALHIDYGNREESGDEAAFLSHWTDKQGICFRLLKIPPSLRRGTTQREEYERATRELRFRFYAEQGAALGYGGVMVGHHAGDVEENVISNAMKGTSLLNLAGMAKESVANGVKIWRPLLDYRKSYIFDLAHRYGVPYFKDTTPTWSTRGKLRNQLVPLLKDMYGDGVLTNLYKLGEESDNIFRMISTSYLHPFWRSVFLSPLSMRLDLTSWGRQPALFWKEGLKGVLHGAGVGMMKDKAVRELMLRLSPNRGASRRDKQEKQKKGNQREEKGEPRYGQTKRDRKPKNEWVPLKKDNETKIHDGRLFIFHRELFHPTSHLPTPRSPERSPLPSLGCPPAPLALVSFPFQPVLRVGPWTIRMSRCEGDASLSPQLSFEHVASGRFSYLLPLSSKYALTANQTPAPLARLDRKLRPRVPLPVPFLPLDGSVEERNGAVRVEIEFTPSHPWPTKLSVGGMEYGKCFGS